MKAKTYEINFFNCKSFATKNVSRKQLAIKKFITYVK